ncbi:MAG: pseudaminic acid synthase [Patescibacteria group bacterium]
MDIEIVGRKIGPDFPPYIVAEMSGNHNGDINCALAIIKAAKDAGADAIKLQTYTADTITIDHNAPEFIVRGGKYWNGRRLYELYQEAHTPWEWHKELFDYGKEIGITVFSTPFDPTAVNFLENLGVSAYKVASYEIIDLPLITEIAKFGKPMIISTGMASEEEIRMAHRTAWNGGCSKIIFLHCVSGYPAQPEEFGLDVIRRRIREFGTCGLSDHSYGTAVAVASVALGAVLIEKHFTLSRVDGGVDSGFSLEPHELRQLVRDCQIAWKAVRPSLLYGIESSELPGRSFRRSLYVVKDIKKGEKITDKNVRSIRPGLGMLPRFLPKVLGRYAKRDLKFGTPLSWDMIE